MVIIDIDGAGVGGRKLHRLCDNGVEHGFGVERRVDRVADLAKRAQFGDRLGKFLRSLLDLLFQVSVGFPEFSSHVVELVGEFLQFVAGLDGNALGQVTAADAGGAKPQRTDRPHHSVGEKHARQKRQAQAREQQQTRTLDRGKERLIGLARWQLHEYDPAERGDMGICGQHLAAVDVFGLLDKFLFIGPCRPRRPHLGQLRHIGVTQH